MVPEFDAAVFSMNVGDISEVVKTDYGYHIIKLNEIQPSTFQSFEEVKELIKSCNFFNNKAKNLIEMAKIVEKEYNGTIPKTHKELIKLPGVGNKTANVFLIELKGENKMAVDTHVFRVVHRLGITDAKNVIETEKDLIIIRKKAKDYGTKNKIEGELKEGDKVIIVEDVTTTGGSVLKAVKEIRENGGIVDRVFVVVDRLEGAKENLQKENVELIPLVTVKELQSTQ